MFRLLMQSYRFLFFFQPTFHEIFEILKNCPYCLHKVCTVILHSEMLLRAQWH